MDISINEILEQDPISQSRITINENFLGVKSGLDNITSSLLLDTQNGTIDISTQPIGSIKAKAIGANKCIFPSTGSSKVSINELNDGQIVALIGKIDSVTSTTLTVTGLSTLATLKTSGTSQFLGTVSILKGLTKKREMIGSFTANTTKTISNGDCLLGVTFANSGYSLTLSPNAVDTLLDGHEVTILNVGTAPFNITTTNVVGYNTILLAPGGKSSIVLHYNLALSSWYIVASNGLTLS